MGVFIQDLSTAADVGLRYKRLVDAAPDALLVVDAWFDAMSSRLGGQELGGEWIERPWDIVAKNADKRKAWEDVHWALINAKEFLFRH